jgi:hypothetical protein
MRLSSFPQGDYTIKATQEEEGGKSSGVINQGGK